MTDYPMNRSPRCGAKNRAGRPCRAPALRGKKRCRLHGGWSPGAPRGELHHNWRGGKYSRAGKELITGLHQMRRDGEALLATSWDAVGLPRKVPKAIRRKAHVRRARAEFKKAKAAKEETK